MTVLFIRLPELRRILGGVSTMTIARWEAKGILPARVHLGPNVVAWPAQEIEAFAERLIAKRQNGADKADLQDTEPASGDAGDRL